MKIWKFELNLHLCNFSGKDSDFNDVKEHFYNKKNDFQNEHNFYLQDFKWDDYTMADNPEEWLNRKYIDVPYVKGFIKHEHISDDILTETYRTLITSKYRFTGNNNTIIIIEGDTYSFVEMVLS